MIILNKPEIKKYPFFQSVPDINYSFYLKCLARLAILGAGILIVIAGLMIASQSIAVLGGTIAVASGISLYKLFSTQTDVKKEDTSCSKRWAHN